MSEKLARALGTKAGLDYVKNTVGRDIDTDSAKAFLVMSEEERTDYYGGLAFHLDEDYTNLDYFGLAAPFQPAIWNAYEQASEEAYWLALARLCKERAGW